MKFTSIFGGAKLTPPEVANNSWVAYRSAGTVLVFIHGVQSSAKECWFNPKTGAYWPNLVRDDGIFAKASIFLGGYYTQVDAGEYGIRDCAKELLEGLDRGAGGNPAVLAHERLVFVCHSLGGIVTRYMLECWREVFQSKAILLVLIASPSIGSQWANSLERVIELFRNRTGRELLWKSDSLDDLDRRFKEMRDRQIIPRLAGCEWCEQRFPKLPGFTGIRPIVAVDSAARYFGDYQLIPGSDHLSIVKPAGTQDRVHLLLCDAFSRFDRAYPAVLPLPPKPDNPEAAARPASDLFQCERMALTIRIYDDGDGHNQMAFEGIRTVRGAEGAVYQLHQQWADSGRVTDYIMQPFGSSPGIWLGLNKGTAHFDPAPSPERPQRLLIESLDAHSYAMDREELSGSGGAPRADLDYAQFNVRWEMAGTLVFQVSFSNSMSLANEAPFVLAYHVFADGEQEREIFDSALTLRASEEFFYSPLLRTAFLSVRRPPQRSAYRIHWRLGQPLALAVPTTPMEVALLAVRRNMLLSVRESFAAAGTEPGGLLRKAKVVDLLATIGDYVADLLKKTVAKTDADEAALRNLLPHLEITLMAMDPAGRVLRFVAGTYVASPAFWGRELPLGEGIAGRAARLLDARIYDDEEVAGTIFAGVYNELEAGKRHTWLISVPLWSEDCGRAAIGVLNIGIFDRSGARTLRVLGEAAQVRELAAWANAEFLPRLLDVVSSNQEIPKP